MKKIILFICLLMLLVSCKEYDYQIKKVIEPNEIIDINPAREWDDKFISISCSENVITTRKNPYEEGILALNHFWIFEKENKIGICDIKFKKER